jgi:predicted DNA-binding antitoxin AbrB/MazE fold protein
MNAVKAIYEHGHLRLLEPLDLDEGQQVEIVVQIRSEADLLREVLADLNVQWADPDAPLNDDMDEDALRREIVEGTRNTPPLSEAILQERYED